MPAAVVLGLTAAPALAAPQGGPRQQVAGLLFVALLALAGGALQPVLAVLFPRWTTATRSAAEGRRGLCLLWGFLISLFVFIVLALCSGRATWLAMIAALLLLFVDLMGVAGYVGIAASFGACLVRPGLGSEDRTPLQALAGGLTLCFASLVPILGQILGLALLFASVGAAALAMFRRPEDPLATAETL
jgi:MFS family permease